MGDMQHIGVDIVHVPGFREQLERPGSRFEDVFTALELRVAARKPDRVLHLAGRWAAKEAFIKAWSQAIYGRPPVIAPTWSTSGHRNPRTGGAGWASAGAVAQAVADSIEDVATTCRSATTGTTPSRVWSIQVPPTGSRDRRSGILGDLVVVVRVGGASESAIGAGSYWGSSGR